MKRKLFSIFIVMILLAVTFIVTGVALAQDPADNSGSENVEVAQDDGTVTESDAVTDTAEAEPTDEPTAEPTDEPTAEPTDEPTAEPTDEPTAEPTDEPTAEPTDEPTAEPTDEPTAEPTDEPTAEPTDEPTAEPTDEPTAEPTDEPTAEPTVEVITSTTTITSTVEVTTTVDVGTAGDIEAQANPTWVTDFAVMNLDSTDNQVSIEYYSEADGSLVNSVGYNVPVNLSGYGSVRVASSDIDDTSFAGAALLSGSGNTGAAVRLIDSGNGNAMDMYSGAGSSDIDTTLYFLAAHRSSAWNDIISIQNTSSTNTANVTIYYRTIGETTVVFSETFTIDPLSNHFSDLTESFYQDLNDNSGLASWGGSAIAVSNNSVPIAGRAIQLNSKKNLRAVRAAFVDAEKTDKAFLPGVLARNKNKGGGGWVSWIGVLNVSGSPIQATVTFTDSNGTGFGSLQKSIDPFSFDTFLGDEIPAIKNVTNWSGVAVVTSQNSSQEFVAELTQVNNRTPKNNYYLYKGFKVGSDTTLYFPYVEDNKHTTYFVVQNTGNSSTDLDYFFYNLDGSLETSVLNVNVDPGTRNAQNTNVAGLSNWKGGLMVVSDGQPIEGIATMCDDTRTSSGYDACGTYTAMK